MDQEQVVTLILGIAGALLQLVYQYLPAISNWLDNFQYKGLVILGLDAVVGGILFGLACTPYAADIGIGLACDQATGFLVLKALVSIALAQQGAYLVLRRKSVG